MYSIRLGLATYDSLVLIDEVGRGTSVREGVAISHAIAEELIRLKVWRGLERFAPILTRLCSSALRILCNVGPVTLSVRRRAHYPYLLATSPNSPRRYHANPL